MIYYFTAHTINSQYLGYITLFRYENAIPLPGLPSGSPDHGFCVLHQKLQMINCCIEVKIAREKNKDEKEESIPLVQPDEVLSGNDDTGKSLSEVLFFWSINPKYSILLLGRFTLIIHQISISRT